MPESNITQLNKDVSILQQNMAKVGVLVDRLDTTIDKLAEVSSAISKLTSVHEMKLNSQEELQKETVNLVEKRRMETENKVDLLHARISSGEKELKDLLDDKERTLMDALKVMRNESVEQHNALSNRITKMEKWMWMVVGGSIMVGIFIQKFPWDTVFS